jgi:fluoride exporter
MHVGREAGGAMHLGGGDEGRRALSGFALRRRAGLLAAVFVGGALGTLARYLVALEWPNSSASFPLALFVVNTSGAFFLGLLLTVFLERLPPSPAMHHLRLFATTGVLGGYTTYSTLSVDAAGLGHTGHYDLAVGFLATSLVAGLLATVLGRALARSRAPSVLVDGEVIDGSTAEPPDAEDIA